jgi:hypothetical protein
VIQWTATGFAGATDDHVYAPARLDPGAGFAIGAGLVGTAATCIYGMTAVIIEEGEAVVTVDELGAFVAMAMASQYQIDTVAL